MSKEGGVRVEGKERWRLDSVRLVNIRLDYTWGWGKERGKIIYRVK